jgi:hypothetical protein
VQPFWGDLDKFLLLDTARRADRRLKRSRLTIFEGCGHFSCQDRRDAFARMVIDWVDGGYTRLGSANQSKVPDSCAKGEPESIDAKER